MAEGKWEMTRNRLVSLLTLISVRMCVYGQLPAPMAHIPSDSAHLAVVNSTETADLAGLVLTELSGNPEIRLIERSDLARIGDELRLQQLAGGDAVALGRLIGADGVLYLDKGPNGIHVRFTAVGLGYTLFDDQIGSDTDLPQLAKSIAHRIASYVPKLHLDPGKALPLSVLNLRADVATPESTALERKLTLLLESRLASLPEYVVVERRHAWSLGFERSLATAPPLLLQGACVVDGTLSLPTKNQGDVVIHMRLRSPENRRTSLEVRGPVNDLNRLVESMTAEIRKATGKTSKPAIWDSKKEAREYLMEGLWGWQHDADDAALEALDSAELLGEKATDLIPLRIGALCRRASQSLAPTKRNSPQATPPGSSAWDQIIDDTLRAIADAARYESNNMEPQLQILTWQRHPAVRTDQIKETLANFASELLVHLDAQNSSRADELRQELRKITGYDPLNGKLGRADYSKPLNVLTDPRAQWDITLAEQLAYYHLLSTLPHQYLPPGLLTGQGKDFCNRFLKTPDEQRQAFRQFLQRLKSDPNGRLAYDLILSCSEDGTVADAAYTDYWREMWKRRESLVTQKVQVQEWTSARPVPEKRRREHAKEMIPLLHYYLTHVNNDRYWEYSWETMWQPEQWSEAEATAIWADFLDFQQRANSDNLARGYGHLDLSKFEVPFQKMFPRITATNAPNRAPEPLIIHRLWHPWLVSGTPDRPAHAVQVQEAGDALWLTAWFYGPETENVALFKISLPDFKAERISLAEKETMYNPRLSAGSKAIYLDCQPRSKPSPQRWLGRFDLKTQTWKTRTMDLAYRECFVVNDTVYLGLDGGIGRLDWDTGEVALLASSRRRPARNQFDDCDDYRIINIFSGPGCKSCVTMFEGTYYIQDQPGNWPEVFDSTWGMESITERGKTLVYSRAGEAVLLDPARVEPEYLMAADQPRYRKTAKINQDSVKQMTPWAERTRWDPVSGIGLDGHAAVNADSLFLLLEPGNGRKSYEMLCYDKDHGRTPRHIPLQFVLDPGTRAALVPIYKGKNGDSSSMDSIEQPRVQSNAHIIAAKDGICLTGGNAGVWFIPYSDMDTYLKTHATEKSGLAPETIPLVKIPPREDDAESQVIGDMIDPAKAEDSFR